MSEWRFEIFFDGECPLCRREAATLSRLDRGRGRLKLTDITSAGFDPIECGIGFDEAMRVIHGRWRDGTVLRELAVFRAAYSVVGLGWLWAPSGWPLIRPVADRLYRLFARHRRSLFGRGCEGACGVNGTRPNETAHQR